MNKVFFFFGGGGGFRVEGFSSICPNSDEHRESCAWGEEAVCCYGFRFR